MINLKYTLMASYPIIDFSDPDVDYGLAELIVKSMYDCIVGSGDVCCKSKIVSDILCEADVKRRAMSINKEFGNTDRYQANVKGLYNLLYNYATCYNGESFDIIYSTSFTDDTYVPYFEVLIDGGEAQQIVSGVTFEYSTQFELRFKAPFSKFSLGALQFIQDAVLSYTDDFRFIVDSEHPYFGISDTITMNPANFYETDWSVDAITGTNAANVNCYLKEASATNFTQASCPVSQNNRDLFILNGTHVMLELGTSDNSTQSASCKSNGVTYTMYPDVNFESGVYRRYIFLPLAPTQTITEFIVNT